MNFDYSKQYGTENAAYIALRAAQAAMVMGLNTAKVNNDHIMIDELGLPEELGVFKCGDKWVIR